jgi:hypothetical protein
MTTEPDFILNGYSIWRLYDYPGIIYCYLARRAGLDENKKTEYHDRILSAGAHVHMARRTPTNALPKREDEIAWLEGELAGTNT